MKIYHYTTLENLVLILKNKTIRFNRLDQMDDQCERNFFSPGLNWSPYTYVSCWTETPDENIPLWHMYSKGGTGIRIGLDKECIDWEKQILSGYNISDSIQHPSAKANQVSVSIQLRPITIYGIINTSQCYHPIKYRGISFHKEDVSIGANRTLVNRTLSGEEFQKYVAVYKDEKWAFQNEVRFILFAVPQIAKEKKMSFDEFQTIIANRTYNPITYIDLPLKKSVMDSMEIVLGPNVSEGTFILAKLLVNEYAPSTEIKKVY